MIHPDRSNRKKVFKEEITLQHKTAEVTLL